MIAGQCPEQERLERLLLGKLPDDEIRILSQHLLHCRCCVARAESLATSDELTDALAARPIADVKGDALQSVIAMSEDLADRIGISESEAVGRIGATMERADDSQNAWAESTYRSDAVSGTTDRYDRSPLPEVPGFEILDTLGFGGMGVVYLARQTSLNRMVALKMIRAHALFDRETKSRFQVEAESIARLAHPSIISIYEVGEANGLPFVALEYVSGGSLAELIRTRAVTPLVAAKIIAKLARAVQYAHDRNVIHRDIKPGNVLVCPLSADHPMSDTFHQDAATIRSEPIKQLAFQPKLTDFGLARLTNLDDRHTRTGAVIGTPAYMAPEQALGKHQDVGTSADIYSLGAILYELLTGRAPFRAGSAVDTMRQVIDDDPVSPRALNSDVSKDLETICMKCLQKRPQARYTSAADLAVDIDRYLNGQPVLARPLSAHRRVARWCQRRPATASLIVTSALLLLTLAIGSSIFAVHVANLNRMTVKAKQNSDNDRSVAVSAITKLSDALVEDFERRGGTVKHRQHLVDVALSGLEQVTRSDARVAGSSIVRAHLARSNLHSLTGDLESSRASLDKAQSLAQELVETFPENEQHQYSLALVHEALADFMISSGSAEHAMPEIERTTEILNRLTERSPQNPEYLCSLLRVRRLMVVVYETLDDLEAVYQECQTYLPVAQHLRAITNGRAGRRELAKLHRRMQDAANALGNLDVAEGHGDEAVALFAALKNEAPPDDIVAAMDYWVVLQSQAAFYADSGRHREATELTDAAIVGYRELLNRDPENLVTKFRLAEGLRCKASLGYYLYDYDRVKTASYESMQLFRELTEASPFNHRYKAFVLCATEGALDCAIHAGDWQELDRLAEQAVTMYHSLDPQNIDELFDGYYGRIYEILWEASRRHLSNYDGDPTADGTCNLLCIYSYLDALQGRNDLSNTTRADIARTCGMELSDQASLFSAIDQIEGRSRYWLGMSLIHEAIAFGVLAEKESSEPQKSKHLQRSVAAIQQLKQKFPVVERDRLYSKAGELNWVMQTELYKSEIAKQ